MPDVSHTIDVSPDGNFIFATGTYKPTVKCFDTHDLSLKFSRGLDADVIKMHILSQDYSKFVLLEEERYLEFHVAYGRYFRMRIPKFGRDLCHYPESGDLYIVGSGRDVYRLNMELGRFMEPLQTDAPSLLSCVFNPAHYLFVCGSTDGAVEAWDPRDRKRVSTVDCAMALTGQLENPSEMPGISALKFRDPLQLAVGTTSGHILLYDIRSRRPLLVKDHINNLPIKRIEYSVDNNLVMSMDRRVLKFWHNDTGKPFAAIEPEVELNDMAVYPNSGLLFMATESPKMLQYFVPSLGPAPKWCSYLETITEELEETDQPVHENVFDDYKFVTQSELEELGLAHLIGTSILRAYMHGYFIDMRLYNKAKTFTQPFAFESYKKRKIREKVDAERDAEISAVVTKKKTLPKVNKDLAKRLILEQEAIDESNLPKTAKVKKHSKQKGKEASGLLADDRFRDLFANPEFEVDESSEYYQLLNPAMKKLEASKKKRQQKLLEEKFSQVQFEEGQDSEPEGRPSSEEGDSDIDSDDGDDDDDNASGSSDADEERKSARSKVKPTRPKFATTSNDHSSTKKTKVKMFELRSGEDFRGWLDEEGASGGRSKDQALGTRLGAARHDDDFDTESPSVAIAEVGETVSAGPGEMSMTFEVKKRSRQQTQIDKNAEHIRERRQLRRPGGKIARTLKVPASLRGTGRGGGVRGRGRGKR